MLMVNAVSKPSNRSKAFRESSPSPGLTNDTFQNLLTGLRHSGLYAIAPKILERRVSKPSNRSKAFRGSEGRPSL